MSVEQLESKIRELSPEERRQFADWFDNHREELIEDIEEVSPDVRAELEFRLKEMNEHPEKLVPFEEEDVERMIQNTADVHAKKSSAR